MLRDDQLKWTYWLKLLAVRISHCAMTWVCVDVMLVAMVSRVLVNTCMMFFSLTMGGFAVVPESASQVYEKMDSRTHLLWGVWRLRGSLDAMDSEHGKSY